MKIIFAKFNRGRLSKFQIVTKILLEDNDGLVVYKEPLTLDSREHLELIYSNYNKLKSKYSFINLVTPQLIRDPWVLKFSFVSGETFEKILVNMMVTNDRDGFIHLFGKYITYLEKFISARGVDFFPCENFTSTFGCYFSSDPQDIIELANVDMTFSNLFLNNVGEFCQIDYEWVFDFPVPKKFIIFRAIHNFEMQFGHYNKSFCSKLYELCRISADDTASFLMLERQFQRYVSGGGSINLRLQKEQINLGALNDLKVVNHAECFLDYGDGFKQEDAIQRSFSDASEIVFDISKFDPIQQLRFDPSAIPGQVKLAGAKLVDEQNQEIKLTITSHNANWTDGLYYNFYHDDPQFIFDVPDTNNAYEKFVVEFTVSPFDVHQISEHVNWATRRINEVEQLILQQQTKIDELAKRLEQKELLLAEKVSTLNMVNEKIVKLSHDLENTSNLYQEKNILLELANKQVAELSIERESLSFRIEDEYQELQLVLATILENQPVQDNVTDKLLFHREQINAKLILLHEKLTASSGEIQRLNCIIQEQMHKAVASLQDELIIQREKNIALNQQITRLLTSVSWKITKPLRKLSNLLKSFSVDKR